VTPGFLAGAGRAREAARIMVVLAVSNLALALVLTPELGVEGPALATAIPFVAAFPLMLRLGMRAAGVSLAELTRRALAPAYGLGVLLALVLIAVRLLFDPEALVTVGLTAVAGVLAYWGTCYALVFDEGERGLVRGMLARGATR
jgi:O-antigen/teichoic acid export membrane protein